MPLEQAIDGSVSPTVGAESDPDNKARIPAERSGIESDDAATVLPAGVLDPVYDAKARVLNKAVSDAAQMIYRM
jgi:hypothetical protein